MSRREILWALGLLAVVTVLIVLMLAPRATFVRAGEAAPNLTLPILGAPGEQSIVALRGLPLLLIFFDTRTDQNGWQIQQLVRLWGALEPRGARMAMVAVDPDPVAAGAFLKSVGARFLGLSDPGGKKAQEVYHSHAFPEGYLIEQAGRVKAVFPGTTEWITPEIVTLIDNTLPAGNPRRIRR
jgi:hypothetical protein